MGELLDSGALRIARIIIWISIWTASISPLSLYHGSIGFDQGTDISTTLVSLPFTFLYFTYSTIKHGFDGKLFPVEILAFIAAVYLYFFCLIFGRTRRFVLKFFDYPKIDAFLWGSVSAFFAYGPLSDDFPFVAAAIFPGKLALYTSYPLAYLVNLLQKNLKASFIAVSQDIIFNAISILIAYIALKYLPVMYRKVKAENQRQRAVLSEKRGNG